MLLNKKTLAVIAIIILVVLTYITYIANPSKSPIFPCLFNKLTGLYCPGCGMTRALHSLMHFNFYQAIRYNVLIALIPPLLGMYIFMRYKAMEGYSEIIIYVMLALAIAYGIGRNMPILDSLQPTTIGCLVNLSLGFV